MRHAQSAVPERRGVLVSIKTPVRYCPEDWMIFDADDQWIASLDAGEVGPEIVRRINAAPGLLAACEEAYEFLDDRTDTYPEPCEDVPALSVMITLKFAIDKAKAKGDPCTV